MGRNGRRGPVPFQTWVQRVAWAFRHIDDPLALSESPLADLPGVKELGESAYPNSLFPAGYALQGLLQVSVDWAVADLGSGARPAGAARFLSLYMDNPSVTLVAKRMGFCREHVSRY